MKDIQRFHLRIAGIGGQGVVSVSSIIARAAEKQGVAVSVIDRPRSAMRLGPITCDIRFGEPGAASFITPGDADAVLGLEPLDGTLNAAWLLKKNGLLLLNTSQTPSIEELVGGERDARRDDWLKRLEQRGARAISVDANREAAAATGKAANANYYLLGVLTATEKMFPILPDSIRSVLSDQQDKLAAFEKGAAYPA